MHQMDRELRRTSELVVNAARIEAAHPEHQGMARETLREVLGTLRSRDREWFAVELCEMLAGALAASGRGGGGGTQ